MRASDKSFLFTVCGAVLLTLGTAMAEPSPSVRLQIPFMNAFAQDSTTSTLLSSHRSCHISSEQAMRVERDTSDPCVAADAAPGGACFDRLGLGALRSQRALLPHDGGQRCTE